MNPDRLIPELMLKMKPDEMRELGNSFLALADAPRDTAWDHRWRQQLRQLPVDTLASAMDAGRRRIAEHEGKLWAAGWHPDQMRNKLVELGYEGADECPVPPTEELIAVGEAWRGTDQ